MSLKITLEIRKKTDKFQVVNGQFIEIYLLRRRSKWLKE